MDSKDVERPSWRTLTILIAASLCLSCTPSPIALTEIGQLAPNEGIAFGQVQVIENGQEQKLAVLGESKFGLFLQNKNTSESIFVPIKKDGNFVWHLPAGQYRIAGFEWKTYNTLSGQVFAEFTATKAKATYIGTLLIRFHGSRYVISVGDDFEKAAATTLSHFPQLQGKMVNALMSLEARR